MSQENIVPKRGIIEEPPEIFSELTKRVLNLDDYILSQPSIKKLGEYAISLNNQINKSIYKKLLSKDPKSNLSFQKMREIRNKYLKKLVESNSFYFPKELGLDEYKKPSINAKEEKLKKLNKLIQRLEEDAKKHINKDRSRKNSTILENKRNRTESIEIEPKKVKKKAENEENEENEENGENGENIEEENGMEENDGEASYIEDENYAHADDDDSQNYNYSYDEGNDEGDDYY